MSTLDLLAEIVLVLQLLLFVLFMSAILIISTENSMTVGTENEKAHVFNVEIQCATKANNSGHFSGWA